MPEQNKFRNFLLRISREVVAEMAFCGNMRSTLTNESLGLTMVSEVAEKTHAAPGAQKSERSKIEFPYNDLDNAIEIVNGVHQVQGTACQYEQLAAHLHQEAKGGGFRLRVTGAKCYGLITYERGGRITLTDLGKKVLESDEEKEARIEAFLHVPLYKKVFDEFKGRQLPPQAGLERAIQGMGVGEKVKDKARQVMLRSAKQAGFFDLSADRLTLPPIKQVSGKSVGNEGDGENKTKGGSNNGGGGDDGGNSGHQHPLIQGLLLTLPNPDTKWSVEERKNWLVMANSIFKMIYKYEGTDGDVSVSLAKEKDKNG